MKKVVALLLSVSLVIMFAGIFTQGSADGFKYVGVKKCKMCHKSKKSGNQFGLWQERGHAKAFATLATEEAKAVAEKAGIKGNPQEAAECLVCHVTGHSADAAMKEATLTLEEGVSCEACHGPGSEYKSMKTMKGLTAGTVEAASVGLVVPTKEVCVGCHNKKSPTYKEFVFEEAVKTIAHPTPEK